MASKRIAWLLGTLLLLAGCSSHEAVIAEGAVYLYSSAADCAMSRGAVAPWAAAQAGDLAGGGLLGYAAAAGADIGVNAAGGGLAAGLSDVAVRGELDWGDVAQGALIGGMVPLISSEALSAAVAEEAGLAGEIMWGINGGGLGVFASTLDPNSPFSVRPKAPPGCR